MRSGTCRKGCARFLGMGERVFVGMAQLQWTPILGTWEIPVVREVWLQGNMGVEGPW